MFVSLIKFKVRPTIEFVGAWHGRTDPLLKRYNLKILNVFWTLGRYDVIMIFEAPSINNIMKYLYEVTDILTTETMVAITESEAEKLLG